MKLKRILSTFKRPFVWFRKTRRRNKVLVIIVLLILFFVISRSRAKSQPQYQLSAVERGSITQFVSETGNVNVIGRADVFSTSKGVIERIYVSNRSRVTLNQALFRVKSTASDEEKAAAYANYQAANVGVQVAKNNLRDAQASLARVLDEVKGHDNDESFALKEKRTTAEVAKDNAFDGVRSAEAKLKATSAALAATQNSTVRAPIAGTIVNFSAHAGDKIGEAAVLTVVGTNKLIVDIFVSEVDVTKIEVGQTAKFTLDAIDDKNFTGKVTHVDTLGTNTSGVITYKVQITFDEVESVARAGMTADVEIEVDKVENTLTVPNSAVKPYQGGRAVRVVESGEIKYIPVKIGIRGEDKTEIIEGIEEGQMVITSLSNEQLRRGPFGR